MSDKPKIICLCGSTKFKAEFEAVNKAETLAGNIVLSVGCFGHADRIPLPDHVKQDLDRLHFKKIVMADEILVINPGMYIGESTMKEIQYATSLGKPVRYLVDPTAGKSSVTPSPKNNGADWVGDLEQLHTKFGDMVKLVENMEPNVREAFFEFRVRFLEEELMELRAAPTPAHAVDAIIDLMVVGIGTLHAFGVDARKAWAIVHAANMAKEPGGNPNRPNPFGLPDLTKPVGWMAPTHDDNTGMIPGRK